jgi:hypothetical protein
LFAELEGPLITLEFASLEDVCGGLGYNSDLTFPTASQVPTFSFIGLNLAGKGGFTPINTIKKIIGGTWINPKNHSLWFAVGLKVEAFECLSVKAVIGVEFNNSELGITAVMDFSQDTISVEAELAPSSCILNPNCHLIGCFGLCYCFAGSPYEGDWVFTIIEYHPSFNRPPHYPKPTGLE